MRSRLAVLLALALATVSLAGCLTDDGGGDELSREERHERIMTKAREVAEDLDTPEEAKAAGYVPDEHCIPGMGVHWIHKPGQPDSYVDTQLEIDNPEVVLFLPDDANLSDTSGDRFLAIEYLVVTQGTDMNTTETKPDLMGVPFDGPMSGHSPQMPWHVDFHVYLAEGYESGPDFPAEQPDKITCPEGTTPPAPGGGGDGSDGNGTADASPVEVSLTETPAGIHRTLNASASWTVSNVTAEVGETSLHWAEHSVADPSADAYGNETTGSTQGEGFAAEFTVPGAPNASGTLYLRAHATVDGTDHWSDEVEVPIEALEVNEVTMTGLQYDPASLEVEAPAYVVWTNEDNVDHTVTFEELNGTEDSEFADLGPGESVGYVFTEAGTFRYRCTYHSADYSTGMVGEVTVTDGGES